MRGPGFDPADPKYGDIYDPGQQIRKEDLDKHIMAARIANEAVGVELFEVVVPGDQTMHGEPVSQGNVKIQLQGDWYTALGRDATLFWQAYKLIEAEEPGH